MKIRENKAIPAPPILAAQSIDLSYGETPVIADLSIELYPGSFIGLIGPNGAGKTTLLLALSGQFKPQNGVIRYKNENIYQKNIEYKRVIGFVHENPFFYPQLNVFEFLTFVARVKKLPRETLSDECNEALATVHLAEERDKLTANLSTGMRKKLAIAASLIGDPAIIFLDEALSGIDVESAFHIKNALAALVAKGKTILLSTHILEMIEKICDRYVVLKNGKIIEDIDARSFAAAPSGDLESHIIKVLRE